MCYEIYETDYEYELNELIKAIRESEREKLKDKIQDTRKENNRLKKELEKYKKIEKDIDGFKDELIKKYEQKIKDYKSNMTENLLNEKFIEVYTLQFAFANRKKCNKCNNERKIHYKTPLGKDEYETCDCAHSLRILFPKKIHVDEIKIDKKREKAIYCYRYYLYNCEEGYGEKISISKYKDFVILDDKTDDEVIKEIKDLGYDKLAIFTSYEKCQEFCIQYLEKNKDKIEENDYQKLKENILKK